MKYIEYIANIIKLSVKIDILKLIFLIELTQISNFPGKKRSGTLKA